MNRAFLALGSNIEPERHLPRAVSAMTQFGHLRQVSSVWESDPVGYAAQPRFLNAAVLLETSLSVARLRTDVITAIEEGLRRIRDPLEKNGPRTIDVDLALFNAEILRDGHREIPDPDILTRTFLAVPLAELAPDYVHPVTGRTLQQIAEDLVAQGHQPLVRRDDVSLLLRT